MPSKKENNRQSINFRFHRGSLNESLKTMIVVTSIRQLVDKINSFFEFSPNLSISDIKIKYQCFDKRLHAESYIVTCNDGIIGFCDGILGSLEDCCIDTATGEDLKSLGEVNDYFKKKLRELRDILND